MRRLLDDLGEVIQRKENESTQDAVWRTLLDAALFQKKGYKTTQGRYGAIICDGLAFCNRWNQEGYWATTTATELNMLTQKAVSEAEVARHRRGLGLERGLHQQEGCVDGRSDFKDVRHQRACQ